MLKRKSTTDKENEAPLASAKMAKYDENNNEEMCVSKYENELVPTQILNDASMDEQMDESEEAVDETTMLEIQANLNDFKSILRYMPSKNAEYFVCGEANEMPAFPFIHVKNIGIISLPLIDSQANEIIRVSV